MYTELDATQYESTGIFYHAEFEVILSGIITCCADIAASRSKLQNNENLIRDHILYQYLKKADYKERYGLSAYLFDPELPENTGRIDIRIMPVNPFVSDEAYYIIECKRINTKNLKGITGLNMKYVTEGMCRYTTKKYSSHYGVNGMIGFVVESMDISSNIATLNSLLKTVTAANTAKEIAHRSILPTFAYSYCSSHTVHTGSILIYHLMVDFSGNISLNAPA